MTRPTFRDALLALILAVVMGLGWTVAAWPDLTHLRLPDTDDVMRLVQVRDWIGGQGWADLAQHRLGDLPMHWTRLGDLGPAGLILALTPIAGRHAAEVAAVIAWPLILFAAALWLVARIARAIDPALAPVATIVAALAYPATSVFLPGRIDHHGLQLVLLLIAVLAQVRSPTLMRGAVTGIAAAASLVVGLETMPFFAVLGGAAVIEWVHHPVRARLAGLGAGALVGLGVAVTAFAPRAFDYPACDGFTADAWRAATILALVPIALVLLTIRAPTARLAAAAVIAVVGVVAALVVSPRCIAPYGAVDPVLGRLWLSRVGEAQPLFAAPWPTAIGYAGLLVVGLAATGWRWWRTRTAAWGLLTLLAGVSLALALVQLRGAYAGAILVAPALAAWIAAARRRGTPALAAAWIGSAGIVYPALAQYLPTPPEPAAGNWWTQRLGARLAALPTGSVLAPVDAGPLLLATTPHRVLAAPYHRNAPGTLAAIGLYHAAPTTPTAYPRLYGLACPAVTGPPGSLAAAFARGTASGWRLIARDGDASLWARIFLSPPPAPR